MLFLKIMKQKTLPDQIKCKRGKEKIKEFVCPDCGGTIYSPDKNFNECPYCAERVIVLNDEFGSMIISSPDAIEFLKSFDKISNSRIIFDRRKGERRKQRVASPESTRASDRRKNNSMTLGWMSTNKKKMG